MSRRRRRVIGGASWYALPSVQLNGVKPSLYQDFVNQRYYTTTSGTTAFPYSSVRTSNAMTFDSQGQLVWAPANMLANSEATWTGIASATATLQSSIGSPTGAAVYKLVANNAISLTGADGVGGCSSSSVTVIASQTYCFAFYAKAAEVTVVRVREATATGCRILVDLLTGIVTTESGTATLTGGIVVTSQSVGNGWWRISARRTASGTTQAFNIKQGDATGDGVSGIYLTSINATPDDAATPQPFVATTGTAYYGPRFYYNPTTLAAEGVLAETAQTNDIARSNVINSLGGGSAGTGGTYLGGWVFPRFTADGLLSAHFAAFDNVTPGASTVRRVYAIVHPGTATHCQLTTSLAHAPADAYINVNFSSGTVVTTGAGASAASCVALTGGAFWIGFCYTAIAAPLVGAGAVVYIITADGDARAATNSSTAFLDVAFVGNCAVGQMQMPVLTTGVAVTKAGDNMAITAGSWLDTTQGTMYINYLFGNSITGSFPPIASISDGTANNRMQLQVGTAASNFAPAFRSDDAGVLQVNAGAGININFMTTAKVVQQYKTNDFKGVANNTGVLLDTICTFPASANILRLVQASSWAAMVIFRECRYYPDSSASQAQLQTLTT